MGYQEAAGTAVRWYPFSHRPQFRCLVGQSEACHAEDCWQYPLRQYLAFVGSGFADAALVNADSAEAAVEENCYQRFPNLHFAIGHSIVAEVECLLAAVSATADLAGIDSVVLDSVVLGSVVLGFVHVDYSSPAAGLD